MDTPSTHIKSFRDLHAYQAAFAFQQSVFEESKLWPSHERYALTGQARRSSRSIGANVAEAWGKRFYPAHFVAKLTDADAEIQETLHWISTSRACGYLTHEVELKWEDSCVEIGRMVGAIIAKHEKFCLR